MISAAEMQVHVANTRAFIEADVEEISFQHVGTKVMTPGGGRVDSPGALSEPQRVRIIHQPFADRVKRADDTNGKRDLPEHVLLGMPDADFHEGDTFMWRGREWLIVAIHDKPEYIRKGDVILNRG